MNKYLFCLLLIIFPASALPVFADSWSFPPTRTDKTFEFGGVTVVATTDATENQGWPEFTVQILKSGELQAQYNGIAFQDVFASPDNTLFVGLSNDGLPGTAIVVFDAKGELQMLVNHNNVAFDYSSVSVTRVREWYNADNPNVTFSSLPAGHSPAGISVRDCHGNMIDLWEITAKGYKNALEMR